MAINSEKNYYIHPKALSFTPNYQGHRNIVYVSIVSNAAIKVYHKDVAGLGYGLDSEYQTWRLTATTTALGTASAYIIYARLSRTQQTADIIFSVRDYSVEGGYTYTDSEGNEQTVAASDTYYYIKIGTVTATDAAGDDATIDRILTYVSGELGTDKQINEQSDSVFEQMFEFVTDGVTKLIRVKETFESIKVSGEAIFNSIVKLVKGFTIGEKTITNIATSEDELTPDDSTLPTTGYVAREIESLDEHFLIKDGEAAQEVGGDVAFKNNVEVAGNANIAGNQTIGGTQEVQGVQTLHQGFQTPNFFQQGDIIQGAQVDGDGNAAFASITAPVMQIYELQYNRKTAVQEEFIFSDGDTIETVTYIQSDGTEIDSTVYNGEEYSYIRLGVRKQYEGYMTTFKDEDVLYSNVNIIGESGQPATTGKCWMRVLALDNDLGVDPISSDGLFINAILYSEAQCPGNVNMAPTPHMVISRHGNANSTQHPDRQSVFIISTAAENMVQLRGISSPIIPDTGAYAIVSGKLPSTLYEKVHEAASYISENDPVSYARYGIFENFIQLDHEGLPIKTERYRGEWKKSIATDTELDESGMYVNRYKNTATTYDTVTHNGSLWACQVSDTSDEPSDNTTHWTKIVSRGADSTSYWLYTDVPHVHINQDGVADATAINITVYKSSEEGIVTLTTQEEIEAEGLMVQYSIDSTAPRNDFELVDDGYIELEDGSGSIEGESDDQTTYIYTESEAIPFADVKKYIMFWLYDTNEQKDIDSLKVEISRDGISDSVVSIEYAISSTDSMDNIPTAWFEEKPSVTSGYYLWTKVTYTSGKVVYTTSYSGKDGASGKPIYITGTASSIQVTTADVSDSNGTTTTQVVADSTKDILLTLMYNNEAVVPSSVIMSTSQYVAKVAAGVNTIIKVQIPAGVDVSTVPSEVVITMSVEDGDTTISASYSIMFIQTKRGIAGKDGATGASPFACGVWSAAAAKVGAYPAATDIAPYVLYPNSANGQYYVRNSNPYPTDAAGNPIYHDPATDQSNSTSIRCWRVMTSFEAIHTKILMADWARLARAVFQGDYMFSVKGIASNGLSADYDAFVDGDTPMFDENNRLSSSFTPNLFLDLLTGAAKFNCLSEPFVQMKPDISMYQIDPSVAHNVSIQYGRDDIPAIIFMPQSSSLTDGVSCTVVFQSVAMNGNVHEMAGLDKDDWGATVGNKLVVLCADGRIPTATSNTDYTEGFFMINGIPTRMLFIAAGDVVKLKSVELANKMRTWVVENQSDFTMMQSNFYFYANNGDTNELFSVMCNNNGWYPQGMHTSFASKQVIRLANENSGGTGYVPLNYNVYLNDQSIEAFND